MSPEAIPSTKEKPNQLIVPVNWISSKELIADLMRNIAKQGEDNTDIFGFIYDLGHAGRYLEGFNAISLHPSKIRRLFGKYKSLPYQFQAEIPQADFIDQLSSQIETYVRTAQEKPDELSYGATRPSIDLQLKNLKELTRKSPPHSFVLNFRRDIVYGYQLTQIATPDLIIEKALAGGF